MFFCKEKCEEENVLIGTRDARDQRGRYNIRYVRGDIFVTITQLNKSDSGLYMCGLDNMFSTSYQQIEIVVVDGESFKCFFVVSAGLKKNYEEMKNTVSDVL